MTVEFPSAFDVVAVGAHPDDVEIAVGGTLARLSQQGYRVGIIDLTHGEPTPGSPGVDSRMGEAREAAKILGVHERLTLTLPNRCLFDSFPARVALARIFRQWRPKIVMGIADKTPMASPDHWQAMQITDAAVFYSRLTKWDDEFSGLPAHTIQSQLWYPLGLTNLDVLPGKDRFVVDISSSLPIKLEAIRAYKSQFPPHKQRVFSWVESQCRLWGQSAGFEAGELLISAKTLGITNLMEALCPAPSDLPVI